MFVVYALVHNKKVVFIECSIVYIVTEPNVIKSDAHKTTNDMFFGITNIFSTFSRDLSH